MKEHSKSGMKSEANKRQTKSHGPVERETKEVLAELVCGSPMRVVELLTALQIQQEHGHQVSILDSS